jgi:hypothetical protein
LNRLTITHNQTAYLSKKTKRNLIFFTVHNTHFNFTEVNSILSLKYPLIDINYVNKSESNFNRNLKIFEFEENFKKRWFLKSKKKQKKYSKCKNPKLQKHQKMLSFRLASFDKRKDQLQN